MQQTRTTPSHGNVHSDFTPQFRAQSILVRWYNLVAGIRIDPYHGDEGKISVCHFVRRWALRDERKRIMAERSTNGRLDYGFPALMTPIGFEAYRPALTAMAEYNGKVCENLAAMNKEWTDFITRRLKEELAMPQQIAGCKSVQEIYTVYSEFFQKAIAHYQAEFEQLARLSKTLYDDTVQTVQTRIEDAAHEQRARA